MPGQQLILSSRQLSRIAVRAAGHERGLKVLSCCRLYLYSNLQAALREFPARLIGLQQEYYCTCTELVHCQASALRVGIKRVWVLVCRFQSSKLIAGDQGIRFYIGAPLIASSGHRLGMM